MCTLKSRPIIEHLVEDISAHRQPPPLRRPGHPRPRLPLPGCDRPVSWCEAHHPVSLPCMRFTNRVTALLGVDIPIVQAPMGYIAKPALVSAVSNAGAMGLVPGSLGIEEV